MTNLRPFLFSDNPLDEPSENNEYKEEEANWLENLFLSPWLLRGNPY